MRLIMLTLYFHAASGDAAAAPVPVATSAAAKDAVVAATGARNITSRCRNIAKDTIRYLNLQPKVLNAARPTTCGGLSCPFEDAGRTLVLKRFNFGTRTSWQRDLFYSFRPMEREACATQTLSRFAWAARLLCIGVDYLLLTNQGQPACTEELPPDFHAQAQSIIADLRSIGMRQNDMGKTDKTDFVVKDGRVALVDFTWATINGSLEASCSFNGLQFKAPGARPRHHDLSRGFNVPDESIFKIPSCSKVSRIRPCRTGLVDVSGGQREVLGEKKGPDPCRRWDGDQARCQGSRNGPRLCSIFAGNKCLTNLDRMCSTDPVIEIAGTWPTATPETAI
jgi:hypothetical protein